MKKNLLFLLGGVGLAVTFAAAAFNAKPVALPVSSAANVDSFSLVGPPTRFMGVDNTFIEISVKNTATSQVAFQGTTSLLPDHSPSSFKVMRSTPYVVSSTVACDQSGTNCSPPKITKGSVDTGFSVVLRRLNAQQLSLKLNYSQLNGELPSATVGSQSVGLPSVQQFNLDQTLLMNKLPYRLPFAHHLLVTVRQVKSTD